MDSQWWDPVQNPLVSMNPIRLQFIERAVMDFSDFTCSPKQSLDGMSALDIGCGGGLLSESLAQLGAATTGLDPSEALIKAAKDHAERNLPRESLERLQYVNTSLEEYSQDNEAVHDIVCMLEVVEHVSDVPKMLQSAARVCKDDGLLIVSTLNRTLESFLASIVGAEYIMGYLPIGTHEWDMYQSPEEFRRQVHDWHQLRVQGMVPTSIPLNGKWSWKLDASNTRVNWIGVYRKSSSHE